MSDMIAADSPAVILTGESSVTTHDILSDVCTPWCIFVINNLDSGAMRFTELKRAIDGISQRMLAVSLRTLEREGLVLRTVYTEKPIKVIYALTELGRTLTGPARSLIEWATEHRQSVYASRMSMKLTLK